MVGIVMTAKMHCAELERCRRDVASALLEAKKMRRTMDLSIHEDAELSRKSHQKINELIKHLLAGHGGSPCPAGDRPIIQRAAASA